MTKKKYYKLFRIDYELEKIGGLIRAKRKRNGWSQFELAEYTGVNKAYISKIESGKVNITMIVLFNILDILNLKIKINNRII